MTMTISNELLKCELDYVLDDNNNPWFSGKGVGIALGYKNTNNAIKDHVDDDVQIIVSVIGQKDIFI